MPRYDSIEGGQNLDPPPNKYNKKLSYCHVNKIPITNITCVCLHSHTHTDTGEIYHCTWVKIKWKIDNEIIVHLTFIHPFFLRCPQISPLVQVTWQQHYLFFLNMCGWEVVGVSQHNWKYDSVCLKEHTIYIRIGAM